MQIESIQIKNSSCEEVYLLSSVGSEASFGRDPNKCQIKFAPTAKGVSRIHASLAWTKDGLFLKNTGTYGSILDGEKITSSIKISSKISNLQIGESTFSVEIREKELISSEPKHRNIERNRDIVEETSDSKEDLDLGTLHVADVENKTDEADEVQIIPEPISFGFSGNRLQRKRKTEATVVENEESTPRIVPRGRRGPFSAPAAKQRIVEEEHVESKPLSVPKEEEMEEPADKMEIDQDVVIKERTSSSSADRKPLEEAQHSDRGPYRPNETIKYADLIFHQTSDEKKPDIKVFNNVPNFKRFKPKSILPGHNTSRSFYNNNTTMSNRSNVSIPMIDAKKLNR